MNYELLSQDMRDSTCLVTLQRPDKRNAINDALLQEIDHFFDNVPEDARVIVLTGAGEHFCAGLDLAERLSKPKRSAFEGVRHSRLWHRVFEKIQFGERPVISAIQGAVIGGGLELAAATHVRVADETTFFQLPEGQRGIFVGGGGSVRVPRIIGVGRMVEMMLTGRRYSASDGLQLGLAHYVTQAGGALEKALQLAEQVASNAFLSNYAVVNAIARINDMSTNDGLFVESMVNSLTRSSTEADNRIRSFFDSRKSAST